jgi:hypothetical protein
MRNLQTEEALPPLVAFQSASEPAAFETPKIG